MAIASQSASAVYAGAAALFGCCAGPIKEKVYSMPVSAMVSNDGYAELDRVKPSFGGKVILVGAPLRGEFPDRLPRTRLSSYPLPVVAAAPRSAPRATTDW